MGEHGQLLRGMKKLGYPTNEKTLSVTFERKAYRFLEKKTKEESIAAEESFENLHSIHYTGNYNAPA